MKILFVGNNQTERCGVAEWGRHCVAALRKLGHEVEELEHDAPFVITKPLDDVVFLNWHAGTLPEGSQVVEVVRNHNKHAVISAYLHESSPAWNMPEHRPPLLDQVDVAFVDHPSVERAIYFRTPVWDVVPQGEAVEGRLPRIGISGIRGEGHDALVALCDNQGWDLSSSRNQRRWLSHQEEVNRLASCWINVAHYGAGFGGQASAMGALIAAGQPILINSNRMLETWQQFTEMGGALVPPQLYLDDDLERGLLTILADIRDGKARRPTWLREVYSWPRQAERMVYQWASRLRERRLT